MAASATHVLDIDAYLPSSFEYRMLAACIQIALLTYLGAVTGRP